MKNKIIESFFFEVIKEKIPMEMKNKTNLLLHIFSIMISSIQLLN